MPSVGISRGGWRRRRRWRGCEQNAVQPGADVGVKSERKREDREGFWMCSVMEPSPPAHPSFSKSPQPPSLSLLLSSTSISREKKEDATISKTVFQTDPTWQTQTVPLATGTVDRSFPSVPFVYTSMCVGWVLRWSLCSYQCVRTGAATHFCEGML